MSLPTYELSIWVLTAFFITIGTLLLWASKTASKQQDATFIRARVFFFLLALLYFGLAHFSAYTAIVYSTEMGTTPPCENLLNSTTLDVSTNITTYTYIPSCNQTPPEAQNAFLVGYGYLLWIEFVFLMIGSLLYIVDRMYHKW